MCESDETLKECIKLDNERDTPIEVYEYLFG